MSCALHSRCFGQILTKYGAGRFSRGCEGVSHVRSRIGGCLPPRLGASSRRASRLESSDRFQRHNQQPTTVTLDSHSNPPAVFAFRLSIPHTLHSHHANDIAPWIIHHRHHHHLRRRRLRSTKHLRLRRPALMCLLLLHLHPKTSRSAPRYSPRRSKKGGRRRGSRRRPQKR